MYKIDVISSWLDIDQSYIKPVSLYVDTKITNDNSNVSIALLIEPREIFPSHHEYILNNYSKFDYILTYDSDILKLPNAIMFEFGSDWISRESRPYSYPNKKLGISTVIGSKSITEGHRLRHALLNRYSEVKNSKFFKSSRGIVDDIHDIPMLGPSKYPLFDYQYSIIIENTKSDYYFSEKLIDCLICKSIPIYWGARKISNYFNGIIQVDNVDDIIKVSERLDDNYYNNSIETINYNFEESKKYCDLNNRIINKIKKIIE